MTTRQHRKHRNRQPQAEAPLPITITAQEKLEKSRVALTVQISPEAVKRDTERAYQMLNNRYAIPGFRRGKAPRAILKNFLGEPLIRQEMLESLLPKAYQQAVLDSGLEFIADANPDLEVVNAVLDGEVTFKATVPVAPTIELGDYHSIQIEPQPAEVTDEQVQQTIDRLREMSATFTEVAERAVEKGDRITIDIRCEVDTAVTLDEHDLTYVVGNGTLSSEVEGGIIGTPSGEVRAIVVHLPPDYAQEQYADKDAVYTIHVKKVEQPILPDLTDEFAKKAGDVDTVEQLYEKVRNQLRHNAEDAERDRLQAAATDKLIAISSLDYPDILIDQQLDRSLETFFTNLIRQGFRPERYLEQLGTTVDQLRENWRPEARQMVERSLVLQKLAELEELEPTEEQVIDELARGAEGFSREQLPGLLERNAQLRSSVVRAAKERMALERLVQLTMTAPGATTAEQEAPAISEGAEPSGAVQPEESAPEGTQEATTENSRL